MIIGVARIFAAWRTHKRSFMSRMGCYRAKGVGSWRGLENMLRFSSGHGVFKYIFVQNGMRVTASVKPQTEQICLVLPWGHTPPLATPKPLVQLQSVRQDTLGPAMRCGWPISCHFWDCKACKQTCYFGNCRDLFSHRCVVAGIQLCWFHAQTE